MIVYYQLTKYVWNHIFHLDVRFSRMVADSVPAVPAYECASAQFRVTKTKVRKSIIQQTSIGGSFLVGLVWRELNNVREAEDPLLQIFLLRCEVLNNSVA